MSIYRPIAIATCLVIALVTFIGGRATAASNAGLSISPARQYINVASGQPQQKHLLVSNNTAKPMRVSLSVGQFSVANYTYDFTFQETKKDWIKLQATLIELEPNKSQDVSYAITLPKDAPPGGYYFTIFATTTMYGDSVKNTVRLAETIYLKTDGKLLQSSRIDGANVPLINFDSQLSYSYDAQNTGNTHFFIYTADSIHGLGTQNTINEATHLLLPNTIRRIKCTTQAPLLPGIYKIKYGYTTDGGTKIYKQKYFINVPLWSLFVLFGATLIIFRLVRLRKNH